MCLQYEISYYTYRIRILLYTILYEVAKYVLWSRKIVILQISADGQILEYTSLVF